MRLAIKFSSVILAGLFVAASAFAQYGGGGGMGTGGRGGNGVYTPPKGGYSSGTGAAIGAAGAAAAGLAYFALHNRGKIAGCIESGSDGNLLVSDKGRKTYRLLASNGVVLPPGQRVQLKAKKMKDASGQQRLQVEKVVKDYGACETTAAVVGGKKSAR